MDIFYHERGIIRTYKMGTKIRKYTKNSVIPSQRSHVYLLVLLSLFLAFAVGHR